MQREQNLRYSMDKQPKAPPDASTSPIKIFRQPDRGFLHSSGQRHPSRSPTGPCARRSSCLLWSNSAAGLRLRFLRHRVELIELHRYLSVFACSVPSTSGADRQSYRTPHLAELPSTRRAWFVLDELASLQRWPQLHTALSESGRPYTGPSGPAMPSRRTPAYVVQHFRHLVWYSYQ